MKRGLPVALVACATLYALMIIGRAQPPATFSFGAAGDFTDGSKFRATVRAIKTRNPAFVLGLGDLSYSSDEREWCEYWKETAQYKNILVVAGNHDSGEDRGGNINNYILHCPNPLADVTIVGPYGKRYYFDFPATNPIARFIMVTPGLGGSHLGLDTLYDRGHDGFTFTSDAIDEARARNIKWVFVGMHKNYISALEKDNEISLDDGRTFMTMLLTKKVDIIFQGHEHGYERSKQLTTNTETCEVLPTNAFDADCVVDADNDLVKGAGTVIHVIGTGGRGLRHAWPETDSEAGYFAKTNTTAYGFGEFTLSPEGLSFEFHRSQGEAFADTFTIR